MFCVEDRKTCDKGIVSETKSTKRVFDYLPEASEYTDKLIRKYHKEILSIKSGEWIDCSIVITNSKNKKEIYRWCYSEGYADERLKAGFIK